MTVRPQLSRLYNGMVAQMTSQLQHTQSCGFHPRRAALPLPLAPTCFTFDSLFLTPPLPLRKLADCAQLLEVDDMVRLAVPDSKCVYTYIQELYRSLVQKGLVKTKKK